MRCHKSTLFAIAVGIVLTACAGTEQVSSSDVESSPSGPPATAMPTANEEASSTPTPSLGDSAAPTGGPALTGALQVEGFAEVVADRLQMRVGPSLSADVAVIPPYGDYPPGAPFPQVILGRETTSTLVYLLDGPVAADGFDWYLVAEAREELIWPWHVGWVAAGDAEDDWLVPTAVECPDDPIELADITLMAMSRLRALHCLGGRQITFRGYYVAPPADASTGGQCTAEPAWLVCTFGFHGLRPVEAAWAGDANHLDIHLPPDLGPMPPRPGWIIVTGQFDHPAAAECGDGQPASDLSCRIEFVVTSARSAD